MNYKLRDSSKTIKPIKTTVKITKDGIMLLQPI